LRFFAKTPRQAKKPPENAKKAAKIGRFRDFFRPTGEQRANERKKAVKNAQTTVKILPISHFPNNFFYFPILNNKNYSFLSRSFLPKFYSAQCFP